MNELSSSSSLYLRQHKDNPIYWKEWTQKSLDLAKKEHKPIFVSIGYSSCHWCHVMAAEAFSNQEVADYLNIHFICIKVDRETRPDIDHYFMTFIQETQGQGGWPLNVFLTETAVPVFACTYIPLTPKWGMPGFLSLVKNIVSSQMNHVHTYSPQLLASSSIEESSTMERIIEEYDSVHRGFGMKFPFHSTMLCLLLEYSLHPTTQLKEVVEHSLAAMAQRGLHDHLGGGFFRYCTKSDWTQPHYEKTLYDQAMMVWVYAHALSIFNNEEYKEVINRSVENLVTTFKIDDLFASSMDADTHHEEGMTYHWTRDEIVAILSKDELQQFEEIYEIQELNLIKKTKKSLPKIEKKLLSFRNLRPQPKRDEKIITSWNAILGIGLVHAWRATENANFLHYATQLFHALYQKHRKGNTLVHSSEHNVLQVEGFLEDASAMLVLSTYLYEEGLVSQEEIKELQILTESFAGMENKASDFLPLPAQKYDQPFPSSASLSEFGLLRTRIIFHQTTADTLQYYSPLSFDFHNYSVLWQTSHHLYHSPQKLLWKNLPLASMQISGKEYSHCYQGTCSKD